MFKFLKKPLDITGQPAIISPMKESNISHNHLPSNPVQLASMLTGKTVRYENQTRKSTVTPDGLRTFKISAIEDVSTSKSTGYRYLTAKVQDIDDGGTEKYRSLIVDGISIVV
jgi:hypothetical protein